MFLRLVTFSLIVSIVSSDSISFTECDTETNIGKLNSLSIPGDPIVVGKSNPVDLSLSGYIDQAVNDDVDLILSIQKEISVFGIKKWISIPCVDGYGSCTKKLIDYVRNYNETFVCDFLTKMGKPCSMPFLPGQYSIANYIIPVNLSKVPSTILSIASGKIKVHIEIANSVTLYCVDVSANLELESGENNDNDYLIDYETINSDDNKSDDPKQSDHLNLQYGERWAELNPFWNE